MENSADAPRARLMRTFVALSLGIAAGIFAFAAGAGLTGSWPAAVVIAAPAVGLVTLWALKRPIVAFDETAASRGLKLVSALATVVALVQLARLTVFMVAPTQASYSTVPSSAWDVHHSCVSAYFVAAQAEGSVPNIYDESLYSLPGGDPTAFPKQRVMDSFVVDTYEYPPPFLLLPRAITLLTPDFVRFRMLWFGLNGGVVLLAMLLVARLLGPVTGTRALLLSPFVWAGIVTLNCLQKGNVQAMVIAASMLAMALFARRRFAAGGALLAFATLSKLFPGMLVLYLLAMRQWRALAWTAALGAVFILVTLLDTGLAPYRAFLGHLPGLVGGEAFSAFRKPETTAINFSVPGLVFKLKLFGVPGMSFGVAKIVGWIYTVVVVWATVLVARRAGRDGEKPLAWLAILILATLRSPFLPQGYAAIPALWLLTLLAATHLPTIKTLSWVLLGCLTLNVYWALGWSIDPRRLALLNLVPQTVTVVVAVLAFRRVLARRSVQLDEVVEVKPDRAVPEVG